MSRSASFLPRRALGALGAALGRRKAMRDSIIRRSLLLTSFYICGHAFFYLLILIGNALLDPGGFGRMYTAWAILNTLFAPVSIIVLLLSGYFAEGFGANGAPLVARLLARVSVIAVPWTVGIVLVLEGLFYIGGTVLGADSIALLLLIPVCAASYFAVELIRASLQGALRFMAYGLSWLLWCAAQCALGAVGLWLTHSAWGCFVGMLAANLVMVAALYLTVVDKAADASTAIRRGPIVSAASLRRAAAFCSAFAGFVLFNNADIFLAYLVLGPADLGAYTASSVLPKAIVTATQPVVQIILPVVISIQIEGRDTRGAVIKAIAAAFAFGVAAFVVLWGGSDLACGTVHGIRFCKAPLMLILAAAATPLSVIRTMLTADVAHGRYWLPHLPLVAMLAFATAVMLQKTSGPSMEMRLALTYFAACCGLLLVWVVVGIARGQLLPRSGVPSALQRPQ